MGGSSVNCPKRGIWFNVPTSITTNGNSVPNGLQDDLAVMTRPGTNIAYRPNDFRSFSGPGSLVANSQTGAASGYGVIERAGEQDAFSYVATGPVLSFTVHQFNLGGTILPGDQASTPGMLAPTLEVIPLSGNAPAVTLTTTNTSAVIATTNATPG